MSQMWNHPGICHVRDVARGISCGDQKLEAGRSWLLLQELRTKESPGSSSIGDYTVADPCLHYQKNQVDSCRDGAMRFSCLKKEKCPTYILSGLCGRPACFPTVSCHGYFIKVPSALLEASAVEQAIRQVGL